MPRATIGGDLGLVHDASAFVAITKRGNFYDVEDVLELRPNKGAPLKLSAVCKAASEFAAEYRASILHVDHHVLQPAREHMPPGITLRAVAGGQPAKVDRFVIVRNLLNEGRVRIPRRFLRLANQLREVLSKPTSGGGLMITLPRRAGVHGDVASAFVLALHAAARASQESTYQPEVSFTESTFFGSQTAFDVDDGRTVPQKGQAIELANWALRTGLLR